MSKFYNSFSTTIPYYLSSIYEIDSQLQFILFYVIHLGVFVTIEWSKNKFDIVNTMLVLLKEHVCWTLLTNCNILIKNSCHVKGTNVNTKHAWRKLHNQVVGTVSIIMTFCSYVTNEFVVYH